MSPTAVVSSLIYEKGKALLFFKQGAAMREYKRFYVEPNICAHAKLLRIITYEWSRTLLRVTSGIS